MTRHHRAGVTMVEILVAVSIVGILTGIAVPTAVAIKRNSRAEAALIELRAVDVAVNASCGRGACGPFLPSGINSATVTTVPASLKEFLPSGYDFSSDTSSYAIELESWQFWPGGATGAVTPVCKKKCMKAWAVATGTESTGFTNSAGFATPATIYVTVWVVSTDGDVLQQLYTRAGGVMPVYVPAKKLWRYGFPVLIGVPATG